MGKQSINVDEFARFLRRLSVVYDDGKTGNQQLGKAIGALAEAFERNSDSSFGEVIERLRNPAHNPTTAAGDSQSRKVKVDPLEGIDIETLHPVDVKKLVEEGILTKSQLIRVGTIRFGIPRSAFSRLNKIAVVEKILAASQNVAAVDVVYSEAKRTADNRSS